MQNNYTFRAFVCAGSLILSSLVAAASNAGTGQPTPGQIGLQNPVTDVAIFVNAFHDHAHRFVRWRADALCHVEIQR
jgi:hypothetical protein